MDVCIGLDLGTSALKAVALDANCVQVARAAVSYPTTSPRSGWAEQDPARWTQAARQALAELIDRLPAGARPRAVGLSAQLPTLVILDQAGAAVHPAIVWYDGRAEDEATAFLRQVNRADWYRRSGIVLDAHYLAPMYAWLARHRPGVLAAPHRMCSAKDALLQGLAGTWCTDPSTASGYGVYDPVASIWDRRLCAVAGVDPGLLPPVEPADAVAGTLDVGNPATGSPAEIPIVVGAGDALTGVLGCGSATAGTLVAITGTSTSLVATTSSPILDPGSRFLLSPHALPDLWASEMDLLSTGSALRWLAAVTRTDPVTLMESAAAAPPGAGGVVAFPHLAGGEQGALWDPGAPAAFVGLSLTTSQGDLARALLEGIAFEMHRCVEVWQGAGVRIEEIVLAGGLASSFFATLVASVLAVPVRLAGHADASAAGAAMLAGRGACLWDMQAMQMQARRHLGQVFAPDAAAVDQYAHLARRYEELSAAARSYLAAVRLPT